MGPDEETIWRIGEIANQDAIEIRILVGAGRCRDDVALNGGPLGATTSDDRHGTIQPIISTGKATSEPSRAANMVAGR